MLRLNRNEFKKNKKIEKIPRLQINFVYVFFFKINCFVLQLATINANPIVFSNVRRMEKNIQWVKRNILIFWWKMPEILLVNLLKNKYCLAIIKSLANFNLYKS